MRARLAQAMVNWRSMIQQILFNNCPVNLGHVILCTFCAVCHGRCRLSGFGHATCHGYYEMTVLIEYVSRH